MEEPRPLDYLLHCQEQGPVCLHKHAWQNVNNDRDEVLAVFHLIFEYFCTITDPS